MKKLILIMGMTALMFSCSSPLDMKVNKDTMKEDMVQVRSVIDSTELNLIFGSMVRSELHLTKDMEEMTYRELLENGKDWKAKQDKVEAEQKVLADEAVADEAIRVEKLSNAVMVSCFEKGYTEHNYKNYITYKFAINNKSNKTIRAFKGNIAFNNIFGDNIKTISIMYDQPIERGETVNWAATTDYNQFMDDDIELNNKELKDLKVVWSPSQIMFEDGTTLE